MSLGLYEEKQKNKFTNFFINPKIINRIFYKLIKPDERIFNPIRIVKVIAIKFSTCLNQANQTSSFRLE